ncbi:PX domain protein [Ichthyophthirius multifiliis]|uniref:PX domain protein n=1 Tax=Ichthyophthirius multifiliis TaxID=5932 RepID=G0QXL0_ICHMU|nr:PX domain protein [Ichthyophthirius multifiliis]EGR30040.1 PX domain protein [Ichthyophthirius multifiliis]|eukprot:XP_004031276.1 PX domain protein [Ichthyophthirius multifiliis]
MSYNAYQLQQNQQAVIVNLSEPISRDGGKYFAYQINGEDSEGKFEVFRRYSDFYFFRQLLTQRWPGCFIPPLPSKKILGNKDTKFLEDRRKFLIYFIDKISQLPYIWYSEENYSFIRNASNLDFEKIVEKMKKHTMDDIINKYKTTFSYLSGKEINSELQMKITYFKGFLKNSLVCLKKMKEFTKNLYETQGKFNQNFINIISNTLPQYEKSNLAEFTQDQSLFLFINKADVSKEIQDLTQQNEFQILYDMVRMELKEAESFLEIIQQKEDYDEKINKANLKIKSDQEELSKLQAGKTTFKSLFSTGTKDDKIQKLQKLIEETRNELDNYYILIDLITIIIAYLEIDKFKNEKSHRYYNVMNMLSRFQSSYNLKVNNFFIIFLLNFIVN